MSDQTETDQLQEFLVLPIVLLAGSLFTLVLILRCHA